MSIPPQKTTAPGFKVDNRFPNLPDLKNAEDTAALNLWWMQVQTVIQRQFDAVSRELDKKADKP